MFALGRYLSSGRGVYRAADGRLKASANVALTSAFCPCPAVHRPQSTLRSCAKSAIGIRWEELMLLPTRNSLENH
jgi:hypothetical protein